MTNPIRGLVVVTSNYGVGKTTFALECGYHPSDIVFINDDVKETGFETEFQMYVDLVSISKKKKLLDLHNYCLDLISRLPKSKVIIWDTWTTFQSTFFQYVKANENEFRSPKEWAGKPSIKAGEWYNEAWRYEGAVLSELKNKCDLLILTFHLKSVYIDSQVVPGKFKPGHDKAIEKYSDLRIWLTPNPDGQVPIGLVMKNVAKRHIVNNRITTDQILPKRLALANWEHVIKYWNNPMGDRKALDHERPNTFELSLIEGTLTPEDKRLYEASLSFAEKKLANEQAERSAIVQTQEEPIKEYIRANNLNGMLGPVKMIKVKEAIENGELVYDGEITPSKIKELSK